jgi:hypothetical protein
MGHGIEAIKLPLNWVYMVYKKDIPGWMAGGSNSYPNGTDVFLLELINKGTPKEKCYIDIAECNLGSWTCDEGETSENAVLVFMSGYFYKGKEIIRPSETYESESKQEGVEVYPSPCVLNDGCSGLTFSGLPANSILRTYNIEGKESFCLTASNFAVEYLLHIPDNSQRSPGISICSLTCPDGKSYIARLLSSTNQDWLQVSGNIAVSAIIP